jgi:hypothetical protein
VQRPPPATHALVLTSPTSLSSSADASYKLMEQVSPGSAERRKSSAKGKEALARLQSSTAAKLVGVELSEHEEALLNEVISPEDIEVGFGGTQPDSSLLASLDR